MAEPTIAVCLPVHRDGPALRSCLAALAASDPAPDEVVIAVDGADPDLVDLAGRHADTVVALQHRSGPAAARNRAAAAAGSDLLLFVDADVAVHRGTVGRARAVLAGGGERGGDAPDAVIGSYDDRPPARNALSQYKNLLNHWVHQHAGADGETFWGACGAVRREAFEAVGGFDADTYPDPSIEDIELGYRLTAAGHRLRVDPGLQATHLKRWDARTLLEADVARRAVPWSELLLARGRMQDDLNVDRAGRAKVALAWAGLVALVAALRPGARRRSAGAAAAGGAWGAALALDRGLLRLLARRGGAATAAAGGAWHLLSHLYSGAAFAWALARRVAGIDRRDWRPGRGWTA